MDLISRRTPRDEILRHDFINQGRVGMGAKMGAEIDMATTSSYLADYGERLRYRVDDDFGEELSVEQLRAEFNDVSGDIFERPMTRAEAQSRRDRYVREMTLETIASRGPDSMWSLPTSIVSGLIRAGMDPVELPMMFIPIVGPTGRAALASKIGAPASRIVAGSIEGAVGTALIEPLYAMGRLDAGLDYTTSDALFNVAIGGAFGATMGGIGAGYSALRGRTRRPAPSVSQQQAPAAAPAGVAPPPVGQTGRTRRFDWTRVRSTDLPKAEREQVVRDVAVAQASSDVDINVRGLASADDIARYLPEVRAERADIMREQRAGGATLREATNRADLITSFYLSVFQRHGWEMADVRMLFEKFGRAEFQTNEDAVAYAVSRGQRVEIDVDGRRVDLIEVVREKGAAGVRDLLDRAGSDAVRRAFSEAVTGGRAARPVQGGALRRMLHQLEEAEDSLAADAVRKQLQRGEALGDLGVRVVKEADRRWRVETNDGSASTHRTRKEAVASAYQKLRGIEPDQPGAAPFSRLSVEEGRALVAALERIRPEDVRAVVGEIIEARAAPLRAAAEEWNGRLESALGDEAQFSALVRELSKESADAVRAIAKRFTGTTARSKAEALRRIRGRRQSLVGYQDMVSAVRGSASQLDSASRAERINTLAAREAGAEMSAAERSALRDALEQLSDAELRKLRARGSPRGAVSPEARAALVDALRSKEISPEDAATVREILRRIPDRELKEIISETVGKKVRSDGAAPARRADENLSGPVRAFVDEWNAKLESVYGTEKFADEFGALQKDSRLTATAARALARRFAGGAPKTKKAALDLIHEKHMWIVDEAKRRAAVDGRTAFNLDTPRRGSMQADDAAARDRFFKDNPADPLSGRDPYSLSPDRLATAVYEGAIRVRGAFEPDGRGLIRLFQHQDPTTFMHESGHAFLHFLLRASETARATEGMRADAAVVRQWLGVDDYNGLTRAADEKFAQAFDVYLAQGQAPVPALRRIFEDFRQFILSLFQNERERAAKFRQREPFPQAVRDVVDRLIAPDESFDLRSAMREMSDPDAARAAKEAQSGATPLDRLVEDADAAVARAPRRAAQSGARQRPVSEARREIEAHATREEAELRAALEPRRDDGGRFQLEEDAPTPLSELMARSGRYDPELVDAMRAAEDVAGAADRVSQAADALEDAVAAGRTSDADLSDVVRRAGLVDEDAAEILSAARAALNEGGGPQTAFQFSEAMNRFVDQALTSAAIARRNAGFNARILGEIIASAETAWRNNGNMGLGIRQRLGGVNSVLDGARLSADSVGGALAARVHGALTRDLMKAGLFDDFRKGRLDDDFVRELDALQRGRSGPVTGNRAARQVAEIADKHLEALRKRANMEGANIKRLPGRVLRNSHDQRRLLKTGFKGWSDFVAPRLDWKRIGVDPNNAARRTEFLQNAYATLTNGVKAGGSPDDVAKAFSGPRNIARMMSEHRVLHWKDGTSWLEYNRTFGDSNVLDTLVFDIETTGRSAGLIQRMGPNPRAMLNLVRRKLLDRYKLDPNAAEITKQISSKAIDDILAEVDGTTRGAPAGWSTTADRMSTVRAIVSSLKLGGAVLSAQGDTIFSVGEYRNAGISRIGSIYKGVFTAARGIANARGWANAELREFADMLGVGLQGTLGQMAARYEIGENFSRSTARHLTKFFKMTLLTQWTDAVKRGYVLMMSSHLSRVGDDIFAATDSGRQQTARLATLYGFDDASWREAYRLADTTVAGRRMVDPRRIFEAAERAVTDAERQRLILLGEKMQTMLFDRAEFASPTPGANERAMLNQGTLRGTPVGEAARLMTQFKSFPTTVLMKNWGSVLHSRGGTRGRGLGAHARGFLRGGNMGDAAMMIAVAWGFGATSMALKDMAKGREPRDMTPQAAMAALLQSGGLGIYGDFLLGRTSRFGGSLTETIAGPALGTAADLQKLISGLIYDDFGDDYGAGEVLEFARYNTPFASSYVNMFYTKSLFDYAIFYQLQEMANPGYLRRRDRRLRQNNSQEAGISWLGIDAPSQAIPHGGGGRLFEGVR